jgi:hypothetical protein
LILTLNPHGICEAPFAHVNTTSSHRQLLVSCQPVVVPGPLPARARPWRREALRSEDATKSIVDPSSPTIRVRLPWMLAGGVAVCAMGLGGWDELRSSTERCRARRRSGRRGRASPSGPNQDEDPGRGEQRAAAGGQDSAWHHGVLTIQSGADGVTG